MMTSDDRQGEGVENGQKSDDIICDGSLRVRVLIRTLEKIDIKICDVIVRCCLTP